MQLGASVRYRKVYIVQSLSQPVNDHLVELLMMLDIAHSAAAAVDAQKDDFLSQVSHELRTPMTSIRSFSEILQDDPDMPAEQRNAFLGIIVSESERLTRLINQVLDLAKIEAGRMQWQIRDIDVAAILREAGASMMPTVSSRNVSTLCRLSEKYRSARSAS